MNWILYNSSTGGIISTHISEPSTSSGQSKVELGYTLSGSYLQYLKWDGLNVVRNDQVWVVYDSSSGEILSTHAEEPIVLSGQSKGVVDYGFKSRQPLSFWKYDNGNIIENTSVTEAEDEQDSPNKYYIHFNYARSTSSSSRVLYTGKSTSSSNSSGRYDSNSVIPHLIPCGCKITKVNLVCAGMASSSVANNSGELDMRIDLIDAKTTGNGDLIETLQMPIDGSKYNVGDYYNRNADLDVRESFDLDIDINENVMLAATFKSQTGGSKIAAFRHLHIAFEITEV